MNCKLWVAAALCVVCTEFARAQVAPPDQNEADRAFLAQVRAAWQERQDRFDSYIVEWEETKVVPRDARRPGPQGVLATEDAILTNTYRMVGEGDRLRLTRKGPQWDMDHRAYMPIDLEQIFDGNDRRWQFIQRYETPIHETGFLLEDGYFDDGGHLAWQPVTLFFRPLAPKICGIRLDDYHVSDRRGSIDGTSCRILEKTGANGRYELLWLADEADYRVLRRQRVTPEGIAHEELTLKYEDDPAWGLLCTAWTHVIRAGETKLREIRMIEDARIEINVEIDESDLEYEFSPGTIVKYEGTSNPRRMAIVREDGSYRPVVSAELMAANSREEVLALMHTPPPPDVKPQHPPNPAAWILVISIAALAAAGLLRWRARQGSAS